MRGNQKEKERTGRDEMNLCEFPIAVLSERAPPGVLKLSFSTNEWDHKKKQIVKKELVVEGSITYGLPTAKDEDVVLALIQITQKSENRFQNQKVSFRQGELLEELSWSREGRSYLRLRKAFQRLMGVRLYYKNAWRDNANKELITHGGFGVISSFELRDGRKGNKKDESLMSEFEWSNAFFESFQNGYLKELDHELVKSFRHQVTKRLYRYLDKHFWPEKGITKIELELETLSLEHLGMSRKKDVYDIKRTLGPGITELETVGFIKRLPTLNRFKKTNGKTWTVIFELGVQKTLEAKSKPTPRPRPKPEENCDGQQVLSVLSKLPKTRQKEVISQAISYCRKEKPNLVDGYYRSLNEQGDANKSYLTMILNAFQESNRSLIAA